MAGGKRILIVEDDHSVAQALRRALNSARGGGHSVESCRSAEVALEWLQSAPFDLLISDLRLPGMNGLDLIQLAHQQCPEIHSVLITAYGSPQIEEQANRLTDAYVPKPFRLVEMIQIVERLLYQNDLGPK